MVSIILPVYNGEDHIEEAIKSILNQTYKDIELIVVNDCSTDQTEEVVQKIMTLDSRIIYVKNDTNKKLPASLNVGFFYAKGDYLTWTSDDNLYCNEAIKEMVETLEDNPMIGMVYSDMSIIDEEGNIIEEISQEEPEELIHFNPIGACFLYRKEIADIVGDYDTTLFLAEDYDYWIRIYQKTKILHVNKSLYFYRKHIRSLTSTRKEAVKNQTAKLWLKHWDFIFPSKNGIQEKLRFCFKLLEMESNTNKKNTYKKIVLKYPLFFLYYLMRKS